jgi:hypothetical protein
VCRTGARPVLAHPDALPEVPPPSRTPLSGYPAAAHAAGHPCLGALAAGHEAASAVVTPSRQYKSPAGGGPAGEAAGPGVFVPSLARMNRPDVDWRYRIVWPVMLTSAGHRPQLGRRRGISLDPCRTLGRQLRRRSKRYGSGAAVVSCRPSDCVRRVSVRTYSGSQGRKPCAHQLVLLGGVTCMAVFVLRSTE